MSSTGTPRPGTMQKTERVRPGGPGSGRTSGGTMVGQKAMHFGPSAKRMLARMQPERVKVMAFMVLAVVSVVLFAMGPRILGGATDLIFAGLFGQQLPPGVSVEQAVESVRASGSPRVADMIAAMDNVVPGQGVDFEAVGQVLVLVLALYVVASVLGWLQGYLVNDVVQATVYRLRGEVEEKICEHLRVPRVLVVIQGGPGTFKTVKDTLLDDCHVVLVKESGGCAQAVAEFVEPLLKRKSELLDLELLKEEVILV